MKVPKPKKLKNGDFYIQLRLGGSSIMVHGETEKECRHKAELIKAEHMTGRRRKKSTQASIGDLIEKHCEKYEAVLSPSTVYSYKSVRKNRFSEYMDMPASKIKNWQKVINDELSAGVSAHTVCNGWRVVTAALTTAGIEIPSVKLPEYADKEIPFLQPEEIKPFLAAINGDKYELAALLELHSLRVSEVCALTWEENIDLEHNVIHVRGAVVNGPSGRTKKETNKNKTSTRDVKITIPRLKELLEQMEPKTGQVIKTKWSATILYHIKNACKRAGVTVVGNHGLRHSYASLGFFLGANERELMEGGGWKNPSTMHKNYIRISKSRKEQIDNTFSAFYKS